MGRKAPSPLSGGDHHGHHNGRRVIGDFRVFIHQYIETGGQGKTCRVISSTLGKNLLDAFFGGKFDHFRRQLHANSADVQCSWFVRSFLFSSLHLPVERVKLVRSEQ